MKEKPKGNNSVNNGLENMTLRKEMVFTGELDQANLGIVSAGEKGLPTPQSGEWKVPA